MTFFCKVTANHCSEMFNSLPKILQYEQLSVNVEVASLECLLLYVMLCFLFNPDNQGQVFQGGLGGHFVLCFERSEGPGEHMTYICMRGRICIPLVIRMVEEQE